MPEPTNGSKSRIQIGRHKGGTHHRHKCSQRCNDASFCGAPGFCEYSANILLDFIEKFEVNSSEHYYETPDQVALSACPINLETAHCRFRRHSFYSSQNSADIREHAKNIGIFRHGPPSRHREQPRAVSSLYLEIACSDRILSIVQELRKQVSNLGSNDSDTSSQCAEYEKMLDLFDTSLRARWLLSMSGPL